MPDHGTPDRYLQHLADGDDPCVPCQIAWRQDQCADKPVSPAFGGGGVLIDGIWGGHTYEQRRRIRRRQKREQASRKPVYGCGTEAAYKRHIRRGETPCEACREASRRATAARRAAG